MTAGTVRTVRRRSRILAVVAVGFVAVGFVAAGCSDKSGAADADVEARVAAADPAVGEAVYDDLCAACHGPDGEGGIGVELVGLGGRLSATEAHAVVSDGRGRMPAWAGTLDEDEIDAVVAYLLQTFLA